MQKLKEVIKYKKNSLDLLNEEYDEALKDDNFKQLVAKTKLKRETLIKYTSIIQICAKEYGNCKKCKGLFECKNKITGYCHLPKIVENMLEFSYKPCKYTKKENEKNKYQKNIILYKTPKEIKEASFKNIYKTDKKRYNTIIWLTKFIDKYKENPNQKGLFLSGNFGSGKTYLISAMFNELAKENIKSAIIFWPEYLRDLKNSFTSPYKNDFNNKFEQIKTAPLLLIDDLGAESTTQWSRDEILCPLLQYRMEEKLPTFFTSNLTLETLEQHLALTTKADEVIKAGRIISRIKQLTEYQEMISKNLRK